MLRIQQKQLNTNPMIFQLEHVVPQSPKKHWFFDEGHISEFKESYQQRLGNFLVIRDNQHLSNFRLDFNAEPGENCQGCFHYESENQYLKELGFIPEWNTLLGVCTKMSEEIGTNKNKKIDSNDQNQVSLSNKIFRESKRLIEARTRYLVDYAIEKNIWGIKP